MLRDRFRQRIAKQKPVAWVGESPADVAVFEDAALEMLAAESRGHVNAIRDALALVCDSNGNQAEDANQLVANIPRSSPLSPWRLLVRGLQLWLENDFAAAQESWSRLDSECRPGRIAAVLLSAQRDDFRQLVDESASPSASVEQSDKETDAATPAPAVDPPSIDVQSDAAQVYSAKLVHRLRFDRPAIRLAQIFTSQPEEQMDGPEVLLGIEKLKQLREFSSSFGDTESQLVAALQQTALLLACNQPYSDVYTAALKFCQGPAHDPRNSLLSYHYFSKFRGDEIKADNMLKRYLERELASNKQIPKSLCNAIISQNWLSEAETCLQPSSPFGGSPFAGSPFGGIFGFRPDDAEYEKCLKRSIKAYSANAEAHKTYADWLETKSTDGQLRAAERKLYEMRLLDVMRKWAQAIPDSSEPRLWLVDHLMENEQIEEAAPHVEWLKASREDDPQVRSAPWKLALLETMQLCRRKTWFDQIPEKLTEVEKLWPTWLSRDWLPYLHAAVALRRGEKEEFDRLRSEMTSHIDPAGSLKDACMMLGAAQRMRVPAADLKPLRAPVDEAVKQIERLDVDALTAAASFFWDLTRIDLLYPAYRMHGNKFGKELWFRLCDQPKLVSKHSDDADFQAALLWMSDSNLYTDRNKLRVPRTLSEVAHENKFVAASLLNAVLHMRSSWRWEQFSDQRDAVHQAAQTENDPYYRHWFGSMVEEFDKGLAESSSRNSGMGSFFNSFGSIFADGEFEDDDDDDEYGWSPDPDCDCPDCTAARKRAKKRGGSSEAEMRDLF